MNKKLVLLVVELLIVGLLVACGGQAKGTHVGTPAAGRPVYDCYAEAFGALGIAAEPKTLLGEVGQNGEVTYQIPRPDGSSIPMVVRSLGPSSYAPGEHLAQNLQEAGWFDEIRFATGSNYTQLHGIDLWVFNQGTHITPAEVKELAQRFPVIYSYADEDGNPEYFGLTQLVPNYAGVDQPDLAANHESFVARQREHQPEIWESVLSLLRIVVDTNPSHMSPICEQEIESYWQTQLFLAEKRYAEGDPWIAGGGRFSHHVEYGWQPGEWMALIVIHLNLDSVVLPWPDDNFILKGERLSHFGTDGKPRYYDVTHNNNGFLLGHEFGHGVCGTDERCADAFGLNWVNEWGDRMAQGDFRADFVVVPVTNN